MKEGELVLVDYTGRSEGQVFDTTREEDAEEFDLDREDASYEPVPVLVGEGYVIEGLEEAIGEMDEGESRTVEVPPEKGYGERSSEEVETYPEREFRKQGVEVSPGEEIIVGERQGRVVSAGSGRVRVDFNHPLAGKKLEYDLEIVEKVEDDRRKARIIGEHRTGEEPEIVEGAVRLPEKRSHGDHKHEIPEDVRERTSREIELATDLEVEL